MALLLGLPSRAPEPRVATDLQATAVARAAVSFGAVKPACLTLILVLSLRACDISS